MADSTDTIVKLEKAFWQSMVDKDANKAMKMIADQCLITGPMGTMRSDPADYKRMTEQGDWDLDEFDLPRRGHRHHRLQGPPDRHDEGQAHGPPLRRQHGLGARRARMEVRAAHRDDPGAGARLNQRGSRGQFRNMQASASRLTGTAIGSHQDRNCQ
jgi:hypothetical protein